MMYKKGSKKKVEKNENGIQSGHQHTSAPTYLNDTPVNQQLWSSIPPQSRTYRLVFCHCIFQRLVVPFGLLLSRDVMVVRIIEGVSDAELIATQTLVCESVFIPVPVRPVLTRLVLQEVLFVRSDPLRSVLSGEQCVVVT